MIETVRETRGEGGQTIIMMVLAMTVMFVIGAIAVDVGLWLSERRGAQADSDFVALSGAWELLDPEATEPDATAAVNAALFGFGGSDGNDEQGNASLIGVEVDLIERCVSVDVGHESRPLFFAIFGVGAPEIGAHATACAGAALGPGNLVPFQIDETGPCYEGGLPVFGEMCPIELGARACDSPPCEPRGMLDLEAPEGYCSYAPGAGDIEDLIISGSPPGVCFTNATDSCSPTNNGPWRNCVAIQDGNPKKVMDGVAARVAADGVCDSLYGSDADTVDDFEETVILVFGSGDDGTYSARDCDGAPSPRLVTLIVLKEPPPTSAGPTGFPILAFAGFYIAGCANEKIEVEDESSDGFDPYCTLADTGSPGKAVVYGRFVNIVVAGGGIGDPTDQTTVFGIALVE